MEIWLIHLLRILRHVQVRDRSQIRRLALGLGLDDKMAAILGKLRVFIVTQRSEETKLKG